MTQLTLTPMARASHPDTSHLAAASVEGLTAKRAAVLGVLKLYGPMTHEDLLVGYGKYRMRETAFGNPFPHQSPSGIRSRCAELVRLGLVIDTGERATLATGRKAIIWKAIA